MWIGCGVFARPLKLTSGNWGKPLDGTAVCYGPPPTDSYVLDCTKIERSLATAQASAHPQSSKQLGSQPYK